MQWYWTYVPSRLWRGCVGRSEAYGAMLKGRHRGDGPISLTTALTTAPPSETTSTVAAALWYPYKSYPEDRVLPWGKRTYEVFAELSHVTVSGVYLREGAELWREPAEDPWWMEAVPNVRRCGK